MNTPKTFILLAAIVGLFGAVGYLIGAAGGVIIALGLAVAASRAMAGRSDPASTAAPITDSRGPWG